MVGVKKWERRKSKGKMEERRREERNKKESLGKRRQERIQDNRERPLIRKGMEK